MCCRTILTTKAQNPHDTSPLKQHMDIHRLCIYQRSVFNIMEQPVGPVENQTEQVCLVCCIFFVLLHLFELNLSILS